MIFGKYPTGIVCKPICPVCVRKLLTLRNKQRRGNTYQSIINYFDLVYFIKLNHFGIKLYLCVPTLSMVNYFNLVCFIKPNHGGIDLYLCTYHTYMHYYITGQILVDIHSKSMIKYLYIILYNFKYHTIIGQSPGF